MTYVQEDVLMSFRLPFPLVLVSFSTKIRGSGKLKLISHMEYVARSCVSWQRKDGAEVISKKIMTGTLPVPRRFLL